MVFWSAGSAGSEERRNPLEGSPRWQLQLRAQFLRSGADLVFPFANGAAPAAPPPTRTIWLDSALAEERHRGPNKIRVDVWDPDALPPAHSSLSSAPAAPAQDTTASNSSSSDRRGPLRPALVNFHGGGWVLGAGTDDARWCAAAARALGAVVFSVGYRLAPAHAFPVAVEDCADALLQIAAGRGAVAAGEFSGGDEDEDEDVAAPRPRRRRLLVSGFSAGANVALAAWAVLQDPARWGYDRLLLPRAEAEAEVVAEIAGFVLFYPLLDMSVSDAAKRRRAARPDLALSTWLTDVFEASYVAGAAGDRADARLSPGLMPDEMLRRLPPVHMVLCEYDMFLAEGMELAERIRAARGGGGGEDAGRQAVSVRLVEGEKHGFDKPFPIAPREIALQVYEETVEVLKQWVR